MVKFAWKPIMSALNEREEGIQGALDAAFHAQCRASLAFL